MDPLRESANPIGDGREETAWSESAPPRARRAVQVTHALATLAGVAALVIVTLGAGAVLAGLVRASALPPAGGARPPLAGQDAASAVPSPTATETIPPNTPLATLTPSPTLKPPPTFEPPTLTPPPSLTPTLTPTPTLNVGAPIEGLRGLESPTPTSTPGCEPREDWKLIYVVQAHDTMSKIADQYGTNVSELAAGNCIPDPNVIVIDQELRVPGEAHPEVGIECVPWQVLTPPDGMITVPGNGQLVFNWIGPRAQLNLIRITKPDGAVVERLAELRQNETVDLGDLLPDEGWYSWRVFPLDRNFQQIACVESPAWTFRKDKADDPTATPAGIPGP